MSCTFILSSGTSGCLQPCNLQLSIHDQCQVLLADDLPDPFCPASSAVHKSEAQSNLKACVPLQCLVWITFPIRFRRLEPRCDHQPKRPPGCHEGCFRHTSHEGLTLRPCNLLEQAAEKQAATDYVRTAYSCDQVRGLQMGMQRQSFRMSPLYVPAFVISGRQMLGSKLRTFVSGANPQQVTK